MGRAALLVSSLLVPVSTVWAEPFDAFTINAKPIKQFQIGSRETSFGAFTFVGGLNLLSGERQFAGLSGFRFLGNGQDFAAISDFGLFFRGRIERDGDENPVGWGDMQLVPLPRDGDAISERKQDIDAEGLARIGDEFLISFERRNRILGYRIKNDQLVATGKSLDYLIPDYEIRRNRGIETLFVSGTGSPLNGALVAITEKSINRAGDIFASVLSGPRKGVFFVKRRDGFDITDGVSLPDGNILLLERRFNIREGIAMRLRYLKAASIQKGATVDGPIVFEADFLRQIDNMEGMDIWRDQKGQLRLGLISDDNRSFLQRTLYLEFIIDEAALK